MEVLIKYFDEIVNCLQVGEVIVRYINTNAKVKTSVSSIDYLETAKFHEISMLSISHSHHSMNLFDQLLFFVIVKIHVPLGQSGLASAILDEYEPNLQSKGAQMVNTREMIILLLSNSSRILTMVGNVTEEKTKDQQIEGNQISWRHNLLPLVRRRDSHARSCTCHLFLHSVRL